ncbi:MAG: phosphoribosylanthranilate isomerase [Chromatiales bacterium]|jgi:phosphoribosylanthranilate isomerase
MRTRVKICGITREQDALEAVRQGADAIGLVFYPPSPRAVTTEQAREIVRRLPPFVTVVGLFVDAAREDIERVLERVRIDLLQLHGHEAPDDCVDQPRPYLKAVRMKDGIDPAEEARRYPDALGLLLDTYRPGVPGGTGAAFDWDRVPADMASRVVLAGGLTPGNVEQAIRRVRPYGVDVSGGVEREKGVKDAAKIEAFMRGVRRADP